MMLLEAVLVLMHMISLGRHPGNVFLWEVLQLETTISLGTFLITKDSLKYLQICLCSGKQMHLIFKALDE